MECHLCGAPVPIFGNVLWCDDCIDEFLSRPNPKSMDDFIAMKQRQRQEAGECP